MFILLSKGMPIAVSSDIEVLKIAADNVEFCGQLDGVGKWMPNGTTPGFSRKIFVQESYAGIEKHTQHIEEIVILDNSKKAKNE